MLPALILAGGIWAYNITRIAQHANRNNRIKKRDSESGDSQKNLYMFSNCNFHYEDKRTYNYYSNCTFNIYIGGRNGQ